MSEALAQATQAFEAGDPEGALAHLLVCWRATRSARVAELIELVDGKAQAGRGPGPAGGRGAREHSEWVARAKASGPAELSGLLAGLARGTSRQAVERIAALRPAGDPRLAGALLRILEQPPYTATSTGTFWTYLFEVLVEVGDERHPPRLRDLAKRYWRILPRKMGNTLADRMVRAAAAIEARPAAPPLSGEDERLCGAMEAAFPEAARAKERAQAAAAEAALAQVQGEALLAAVYEAPDDDEARLRYAGWLSERGDPRGEYIRLQIAAARGPATDEQARRAAGLINAHWPGWSGKLGRAGQVWFERGFPERVALWYSAAEMRASIGDPRWSTVRSVRMPHVGLLEEHDRTIRRFFASEVTRHLVVLDSILSEALLAVAGTRPLRRVTLAREPSDPAALVAYLARTPTLRSLGLDYTPRARSDALRWLLDGVPDLAHLTLRILSEDDLAPLHALLEGTRLASFCVLGRYPLVFRRGDDGRLSALQIQVLSNYDPWFQGMLCKLPPEALASIEVVAAGDEWQGPPWVPRYVVDAVERVGKHFVRVGAPVVSLPVRG